MRLRLTNFVSNEQVHVHDHGITMAICVQEQRMVDTLQESSRSEAVRYRVELASDTPMIHSHLVQ